MRTRFRLFLFLIFMSVIGLSASLIVIYEIGVLHTLPPLCTLSSVPSLNCSAVLGSAYSRIAIGSLSVPLEYPALMWFVADIALAALAVYARRDLARKAFDALLAWRAFGIATALYLVYLELFVIKSICIYCTTMHISIAVDLIIAAYLFFAPKSGMRRLLHG